MFRGVDLKHELLDIYTHFVISYLLLKVTVREKVNFYWFLLNKNIQNNWFKLPLRERFLPVKCVFTFSTLLEKYSG